jgi:hypothetical protein
MEIDDILEEDLINIFNDKNGQNIPKIKKKDDFDFDSIETFSNDIVTNDTPSTPRNLDNKSVNLEGKIANIEDLIHLINGLLENKSIEITIKLKDN